MDGKLMFIGGTNLLFEKYKKNRVKYKQGVDY